MKGRFLVERGCHVEKGYCRESLRNVTTSSYIPLSQPDTHTHTRGGWSYQPAGCSTSADPKRSKRVPLKFFAIIVGSEPQKTSSTTGNRRDDDPGDERSPASGGSLSRGKHRGKARSSLMAKGLKRIKTRACGGVDRSRWL
jgi:hypothetical protein